MAGGVISEKKHFFGAWILFVLPIVFLSSLGILILISAGAGRPDPYFFARKQLIWLCIAYAAGIFMAFIDIKMLRKISIPLAVVSIILLLLVLVPQIGREVNGARRWIAIGSILIQPSDLAKFALVIVLANYLQSTQRQMGSFLRGFIAPFAILGIFCALIIKEPDFGTTALCAGVGSIMIFLAGVKLRYLFPTIGLGVFGFFVMIFHDEVRYKRLISFIDFEENKSGGAYQLYQALLAFGTGGVSGVGIGQGRQQLSFLPEAHTDFIFAIVGEELGLVFTCAVVLLFFILFLSTILSLPKAQNLFEFSLAVGAMLMIVLQALFNMCVVTGLMPTKGISLPFISYGGSNLVAMFAFSGLLLNCVRSWNRPTEIKISEI